MEKQKHKDILCIQLDNELLDILYFSSIEKLDQYTTNFNDPEDLYQYLSNKETAVTKEGKENLRRFHNSYSFTVFKIKYNYHDQRVTDVLFKEDVNLIKKQVNLFEKLRYSRNYVDEVLLDEYNKKILLDRPNAKSEIEEIIEFMDARHKDAFKTNYIQSRIRTLFEPLMFKKGYPATRHNYIETKNFLKKYKMTELLYEVSDNYNTIVNTTPTKKNSFDVTTIIPVDDIRKAVARGR